MSFQPLPTSLCCLNGCTDQNQHAQLQRSHQGVLTHFDKVVNLHFEPLAPPLQVFQLLCPHYGGDEHCGPLQQP